MGGQIPHTMLLGGSHHHWACLFPYDWVTDAFVSPITPISFLYLMDSSTCLSSFTACYWKLLRVNSRLINMDTPTWAISLLLNPPPHMNIPRISWPFFFILVSVSTTASIFLLSPFRTRVVDRTTGWTKKGRGGLCNEAWETGGPHGEETRYK